MTGFSTNPWQPPKSRTPTDSLPNAPVSGSDATADRSPTDSFSDTGFSDTGFSDTVQWQKVLEDDPSAFEAIVARYQNPVAAVAYARTGNFDWAQEITQETFWQAWKSRGQLRDPQSLGSWLCGIARNLSLQMIRRESRLPSQSADTLDWQDDQHDPVLVNVSREESDLVWETLGQLPENYREPLILYYREEHSIARVAEVLELSEDAVKQRLSRGREMVRQQLADRVEEILVRSRPNRILTTRIMAGVTALAASMKATGTVSAATTGVTAAAATAVGKQVAGGLAAKALVSPLAGGVLGAAGGLAGAWLGIWLPAQLAETVAQRELLLRRGKTALVASVLFAVGLLVTCLTLLIPIPIMWFVGLTFAQSVVFSVFITIYSLGTQWQMRQLILSGEDDSGPNENYVKQWAKSHLPSTKPKTTNAKCYTSPQTLLGVPLLDIQLSNSSQYHHAPARKAFGWFAIGDRATGLIMAMGGLARAPLAFGGVVVGVIAIGGVSLGVLSFGGLSLGLILGIGGLGLGYHAVGGGAIGYQSASGGGAIAYHVAAGGGALAHDYAVGGGAYAQEVNTAAARQAAQQDGFLWLLEWQQQHQTWGILLVIGIVAVNLVFVWALNRFLQKVPDAPT